MGIDKYKEVFEKGVESYISKLSEIGWFDNPSVNKNELVRELKATRFAPYYSTYLGQLMADVERVSAGMFEELMESICNIVPNSIYFVEMMNDNIGVSFIINGNAYSTTIEHPEEYLFGGTTDEEGFIDLFINMSLEAENTPYRFFELPPDCEIASYVYVKPEVHQRALDEGLIPDFMGYFAVNY